MPEADAEGGPLVAFAMTRGFLAASALTTPDRRRRPITAAEPQSRTAAARGERGSDVAATPATLRGIPTSKETT
jgi:hypothetical protein